jgi:hypothetical protein
VILGVELFKTPPFALSANARNTPNIMPQIPTHDKKRET